MILSGFALVFISAVNPSVVFFVIYREFVKCLLSLVIQLPLLLSASHWKISFMNWPHSALNVISACPWLKWLCDSDNVRKRTYTYACWMWPSPDRAVLLEQHLYVFDPVWEEHTVPPHQGGIYWVQTHQVLVGEMLKCKLFENCNIMIHHSSVFYRIACWI